MLENIDKCDLYQRIKNRTEALVGKLMANEILEKPQTHLKVNFITKLLLVVRKNAILEVCSRLSKKVYLVTTMKRISAEELARLFRDNM